VLSAFVVMIEAALAQQAGTGQPGEAPRPATFVGLVFGDDVVILQPGDLEISVAEPVA
jgi:hypothetical protein